MTITASKLELVGRCPGSLTLPWTDSPNEWSEAGNERHAADEQAIASGDVPDVYLDRWPEVTSWRSEVAYAYDVSDGSARYLGCGIGRRYGSLGPFEIAGTADVEGRGAGILVIIDRKSFEAVTPATSNPQVRFLALAASRVQPAARVDVAISHELTGLDVAGLDEFELDVIAHDTRQLLIRSASVRADARAGRPVPFATGRWCRWCPAFDACPKQSELKALVARDEDDPELGIRLVLDGNSAADVYELWRRIGILHKRLAQSIHAYAALTPIRLPTGKVFGKIDKQGNERLNGDVVWEVVRDLYPGREDAAVSRVATKAQLERALREHRGALKRVLESVRSRGGATRNHGTAIEEYEPGPKLLETKED